MSKKLTVKRKADVYERGQVVNKEVSVVCEEPLTVFLNNAELATMICSPSAYQELTVGFLISEGLLQKPEDLVEIRLQEEMGVIWVETAEPVPQTANFLRRNIASCCGKGRAGLYFINDAQQLEAVKSAKQFKAEDLVHLISLLDKGSDIFKLTGGVHSAALGDEKGLVAMYEDIGRHNAVDKVLGHAFLNRVDTSSKCLILSGRIASEILIKGARANIPLILSRSAPTELTLKLAEELEISVVGFARGEKLTIYTNPERVIK
ncbi:MAG: formate dehydrogenase accessory sulfurtransferase FdhD [Syntrophomonadaceae bacterium]|nr:formate dehydrogenase accessory sulfurtransferase FdhD [Syntrophomonadaceae bacterium]